MSVSTAILIPPGILEEAAKAAYESAIEEAGHHAEGAYAFYEQSEACRDRWRTHVKAAAWVLITRLRDAGWTVRA